VLREIAALPFACLNIATPSTISTGIYYFCIFLLLFPGRGLPKIKKLIILILIAANIFIWNECFAVTPRALTVTFFDVGQADASIIETPSGKVILVDGASGGGRYGRDSGRKVIAEYLFQRRIRKLDMVILSHAHFDHIGGLEYILNNFDVEVFVNGPGNDNRLYREMMSIIRSKGIKHILVRQGDVMKIGGCFTMRVFNPFRPSDLSLNDKSLVIKIIHLDSGKSILYCGDIENPGIKNVTAFGKSLKADILKVPHHGSGNCDQSLFEIFIDNVSAEYAVVTNGKSLTEDNNVAVSLKERGIKTYFSANDGAVVFKAGNKGFFVKKYIDPGGYKMLSRKIKIRDNSE
jgi:competence protein ComEC